MSKAAIRDPALPPYPTSYFAPPKWASTYRMEILDIQTGEIRWSRWLPIGPREAFHYFHTEGNFGCDCNRASEFTTDEEASLIDEYPCGTERYSIQRFEFSNQGTHDATENRHTVDRLHVEPDPGRD